jgi:hypothetical protein
MCFASPTRMGNKPLNSNSVQRDYLRQEAINAGLTPLGWHAIQAFANSPSQRVQSATLFYAAFRPLFRRVGSLARSYTI